MGRLTRGAAILAAVALLPSCQTIKDPFLPQSAFSFDVTDSVIGSQLSIVPTPQIVTWTVEAAYATEITGFDGTYTFLTSPPCVYEWNLATPATFASVCRTSGLTLTPGVSRKATIHVRFSRLELRQAQRPDLSPGLDPDGDGIPTSLDNCPIIYNPDQANFNADQETFKVGDACSDKDASGNPTIADQDMDGVPDLTDNCLWYPSPASGTVNVPPDTNFNGIGDACERVAGVVLPENGLSLKCDVSFTSGQSTISAFHMDFGRAGVLHCPSLTNCTIDPSAIALSLSGSTTTFPCVLEP